MSIHFDKRRDAAAERVLGAPALAMDDAVIAVAERFAGCDRANVLATLDEASRPLFGSASLAATAQAGALGELLRNELGLRPVTGDHDALLVDRALAYRAAHPIVIAAIGHEIGRRAGLATRVCRVADGWWLAVPGDERVALVDCSGECRPPGGPLRRVCAHHVALALLRTLECSGPPMWRVCAARLTARLGCDAG